MIKHHLWLFTWDYPGNISSWWPLCSRYQISGLLVTLPLTHHPEYSACYGQRTRSCYVSDMYVGVNSLSFRVGTKQAEKETNFQGNHPLWRDKSKWHVEKCRESSRRYWTWSKITFSGKDINNESVSKGFPPIKLKSPLIETKPSAWHPKASRPSLLSQVSRRLCYRSLACQHRNTPCHQHSRAQARSRDWKPSKQNGSEQEGLQLARPQEPQAHLGQTPLSRKQLGPQTRLGPQRAQAHSHSSSGV